MKILHIIIDEKFLEFAYRVFQAAAGAENRYVALSASKAAPLKHISGIPLWRVAGSDYAYTQAAREDLAWCDVLIVHWWHDGAANVVAKAPASVIVVWSGWGGDYYDLLPGNEDNLYGESTKRLLRQMHADSSRVRMRNIPRQIRKALSKTWNGLKGRAQPDKISLIKRVDYFSAPVPDDYELMKAALGDPFRAQYVQLNYGSVEETFTPGLSEISGNNILLGNSATPTNNHLEILNVLATLDLGDRKVIAPLSYSSKEYGDEIERWGRKLLGDRFVPLRNFMPLREYNQLISSCSIAIMNHRRQQALGNIGVMLCNGAKLFLDESSVIYKFLRSRGVSVFPVREIVKSGAAALSPLGELEKKRNIEIVKREWGHDAVHANVRKFVDLMQQDLVRRA